MSNKHIGDSCRCLIVSVIVIVQLAPGPGVRLCPRLIYHTDGEGHNCRLGRDSVVADRYHEVVVVTVCPLQVAGDRDGAEVSVDVEQVAGWRSTFAGDEVVGETGVVREVGVTSEHATDDVTSRCIARHLASKYQTHSLLFYSPLSDQCVILIIY